MAENKNTNTTLRFFRKLSWHSLFLTLTLLLFIGAITQWFISGESSIIRFSIAWITSAFVIPLINSIATKPLVTKNDVFIPNKRYIQLTSAHLGFALTEILSTLILIGIFSLFGEYFLRQSIGFILFSVLVLSTVVGIITSRSQIQSAYLIIQKHKEKGAELFNTKSLLIIHTGAIILTASPLFLLLFPAIPITQLLAIPGAIAGIISLFLLSLLHSFPQPKDKNENTQHQDNILSLTSQASTQGTQNRSLSKSELAEVLQRRLTLEEIRNICFDLSIDFEELEGQTKSTKVISMIEFLDRRERLGDLQALVTRKRPDIELDAYSS